MVRILIIILAITINIGLAYPQLTYEGKYDTNLKTIQLEDGSVKYVKLNYKSDQLMIFNMDHSMWKEIDLNIPKYHFIDDVKLISQRTFDQDDQYEILYTCYTFENSQNLESPESINSKHLFTLKIVNESGKELLKVENASEYKLLQINGINKLLIFTSEDSGFNTINYTEIYSLN